MSLPIIVLGAGGHAKVLIDALLINSVEILGITDQDPEQNDKNIRGVRILGNDDIILKHSIETVRLVNGIGSVGSTTRRKELFEKFKKLGYSFASVIHPSAVISPDVVLAEGVQILAGVIIQTGAIIGKNSIINTKVSVDHDCIIGDHVHLAPGVTLSGNVQIGVGAHIGTAATVIQGIRIGDESVIGAGGLVIKDIPSGVTAIGVPVKEKL